MQGYSLIVVVASLLFLWGSYVVDAQPHSLVLDGVYDVVWNEPSYGSNDSMPIGNGDIALNVWYKADTGLSFFLAKMDAWSENGALVKVGRVNIRIKPNPFNETTGKVQFVNKLALGVAQIEFSINDYQITLWVDANNPVVHTEIKEAKGKNFTVEVALQLWRTEKRAITGDPSVIGLRGPCYSPIYEYPDTILPGNNDSVIWFHRNLVSPGWEESIIQQFGSEYLSRFSDPLKHRTFGGIIKGTNLKRENASLLVSSEAASTSVISVYLYTNVTPSVNDWIGQLQNVVKKADAIPLAVAKKQHQQWWADRWSRSWVDIHTHESPKGQLVSRAYVLQRWMDISTGRGAMPIKFNGLVYITHPDWPDYREWGGGYWWQNTRLPYWSMPTAGDTDLMKPLFKMYADVMPMALARTKLYFNHGGIYFPETMYFWGTYEPVDYGCSRGNPPLARWITENTWIRYHITGGLEVIAMMFDYYWHTGDDQFGREVLVPFCAHTLTFYESHYGPDLAGKIILTPAQSLETYQDVINPTTDLAGLISMTENVMKLPDSLAGPLKSKFQQFSSTIPPIPLSNTTNLIGKCKNGKNNGIYCSDSKKPFSSQNSKSFGRKNKQQVEQHDLAVESKKDEAVPYILPAYAFLRSEVHNSENVELYTVFPYNIYGLLKPGLDIAKKTYSQRPFPCNDGWCQDVVQAALLGLYKDAQSQMIGRMLAPPAPGVRFPSFWGPDQDGTPDEDHGAVGKIALQWMLLHADGDQIILFGGWPGDWDVSFQLHAPYNTTVIGSCRAGVLTFLDVNPPSRYKDLVFPGPYCTP